MSELMKLAALPVISEEEIASGKWRFAGNFDASRVMDVKEEFGSVVKSHPFGKGSETEYGNFQVPNNEISIYVLEQAPV